MQKYAIVLLALFIFFFLPHEALAHFLATDKKIGAIIHVSPNDDPVAGLPSSFFFDFKDETNKFNSANCDCTFIIKQAGNTIYSQAIFQNNSTPNLNKASVSYTFPTKDIYQVQVVGKPKIANQFQSFTLSWDFRVDQQADAKTISAQDNSGSRYLRYGIIFGLLVVIGLVILLTKLFKPKKKHTKTKGGDTDHEETSHNKY